jgi:hypothetical protein
MKRVLRVFCITTICLCLMSFGGIVQAATQDMHVYSYVSPPTYELLHKAGLSENDIESCVVKGLQQSAIIPIDDSQVYAGSEDAMRIDLRKEAKCLVINLSVRQGVSVHNMLQRWEASRTLGIDEGALSKKLRSDILDVLSAMLNELKSEYNSDAYKKGSMMEE